VLSIITNNALIKLRLTKIQIVRNSLVELALLHPVLPDIEIGLSKNTVVLMIYPHGVIVPYKINPRDEFFVIQEPRAVGIYLINDKYRFMWQGKTPVYFYAVGNFTPIDPIKIDALNKYKKDNKLTQVRQKDIRHGMMLRHLINKMEKQDVFNQINGTMKEEGTKIEQAMVQVMNGLEKQIEFKRTKHGQVIEYTPQQRSIILVNFLFEQSLITEDEKNNLLFDIDNGKLSLDTLVNELRYRQVVSVAEPLPIELEDFLQDLKQQNEYNLADFVQYTRTTKNGLRQYKQSIVKQYVSSMLLAGIIIGPCAALFGLSQVGVFHMDPRYLAIGGIIAMIVLGRFHYPMAIPPIGLVFYPNATIVPFQIKRSTKFFIWDLNNVFSMTNKLRLVWNGKVACYLYKAETDEKTQQILQETQLLVKKRFVKK